MKSLHNRLITLVAFICFISYDAFAQYGQYVGGDISLLPAYEDSKTVYLDRNKRLIPDVLKWAVDTCGWNAFRVRLFVNPDNSGNDGLFQDIEYVKKLGKRIKDANAAFMLDLHYSDTWADPSNQVIPASWNDCATVNAKATRLYEYTKDVLLTMKEYGAEPDFVQVGNEITAGIIGVWRSSDSKGYKTIVEKGCDAVREVCPFAKIVIHIEGQQHTSNVINYYNSLDQSKYDVIGLSYYPFWHSTLSSLGNTLSQLLATFPTKKVQIVETAYNFQYSFSKPSTQSACIWSISKEGQQRFMEDLIAKLKQYRNVDGLYYWCPEEAGNGDAANWSTKTGIVINSWLNRGLWESERKTQAADNNAVWGHGLNNDIAYIMKTFLDSETSGIDNHTSLGNRSASMTYSPDGLRTTTNSKGIKITNGIKTLK